MHAWFELLVTQSYLIYYVMSQFNIHVLHTWCCHVVICSISKLNAFTTDRLLIVCPVWFAFTKYW